MCGVPRNLEAKPLAKARGFFLFNSKGIKMTSETLRKILIAGAAICAASLMASKASANGSYGHTAPPPNCDPKQYSCNPPPPPPPNDCPQYGCKPPIL